MYFQTRTKSIEQTVKEMVERFNKQEGVSIPLLIESIPGKVGGGCILINRTNNSIQGIRLDPTKYENFDKNRIYIYILLHELGHAYDALNYHADVNAYGGKYAKNTFEYEMRAWELGIGWALDNGYISKLSFSNLKKFMEKCLGSYNKGKYDTIEAIETIFSNLKGVI